MAMTATNIAGFRTQMINSVSSFYTRRGLSGSSLHRFYLDLQLQAYVMLVRGENEDNIKKALLQMQADVLRFPHHFSTTPRYDSSYMTLHGSNGNIEIRNPNGVVAHGSEIIPNAKRLLLNGAVANEGHYAGLGKRLKSAKPKFEMKPLDLIQGLKVFAEMLNDPANKDDKLLKTLGEKLKDAGGIAAVEEKYAGLKDWSIGQRIFLSKLSEIVEMGRERNMMDEEINDAIRKLKFKIIVNEDSGDQIIKSFEENRFFRLNPENVIFMYQAKHPTLFVRVDGSLAADEKHTSQGNHGLIPFQSVLEDQWQRFIPVNGGGEYRSETLSARDYKEFQEGIEIVVVESVEDSTQLLRSYDLAYLGLIDKLGREAGYNFFMQLVNQKTDNPQKGGFLADVQPDGLAGSNHMLESNRAPEVDPAEIVMLNRNRNGIFKPNLAEDIIIRGRMIDDLHPTFEPHGRMMEVRIDPKIPNGDRNVWLNTGFLTFEDSPRIENLKDGVDILPLLEIMATMERNSRTIAFAKSFLGLE